MEKKGKEIRKAKEAGKYALGISEQETQSKYSVYCKEGPSCLMVASQNWDDDDDDDVYEFNNKSIAKAENPDEKRMNERKMRGISQIAF